MKPNKEIAALVSGFMMILLLLCAVGLVVGLYGAIWGDNAFWGRIIASFAVSGGVALVVGLAADEASK